MKKNNFKGFYEDEESLKMMDVINREANKEYVRRIKVKEQKQNKIIKVFVVLSLMFIAGCVLYLSGKKYQTDVSKCVANGESQAVCEYKFSK